ncbi:hypothetical protein GCM10027614_03570 [Micromonospora vulcania]
MVAPQGRRDSGDQGTHQLDGRWVVRASQGRRPAPDLGVPVLVAGEADGLAGPHQRGQRERAVGPGHRAGGGQQRGGRRRGGVAAQLQLAAQQVGVPGDGRIRADRAQTAEQQPDLGRLAGGPGVPGGGQQAGGSTGRLVAEFGGPT